MNSAVPARNLPTFFIPLTSLFTVLLMLCVPSVNGVGQVGRSSEPLHLLPQLREIATGPLLRLDAGLRIDLTNSSRSDRFAADDLRDWCSALRIPSNARRGVVVHLLRLEFASARIALSRAGIRWEAPMREEGYAIVREGNGLALISETDTGMFYAVQTLKQLLRQDATGTWLQTVTARDWPAMRYRGFSDDVTRGGLPTMDFFKQEVRTLAAYKLNVFSLYMQTTFRYSSMPGVPPAGGAFTPAEALELTEYARHYHVTVIPEQESFAHLHTLLTSQQFADLAETPLGGVLAPGQPRSLQIINGWFSELATAFPGPMLHIGADETFDLGKGQTRAEVQKRSTSAVYVDFVRHIHTSLAPLQRRLLFWGDIALESPDEVTRLPKDMIAVTWVYEPHPEGYARWILPFRQNAMETWVAPGVNNWRRVYPDYADALLNIQGLVAEGQSAGSTGMLNTAWNDDGEEIPAMDWYGVLFGAAAAWQPGESDTVQFEQSYGPVFHGDHSDTVRQAQQEMMHAAAPLRGDKILQRSALLFWLDPWSAAARPLSARLLPQLPALRNHAEKAVALAVRAREQPRVRETDALDALELGARKLDFLGLKFQAADRILALYEEASRMQGDESKSKDVQEILRKIGGPGGLCQDLRDGYAETGRLYADLWGREYRPYFLENIVTRHHQAAALWQFRADWFTQALLLYQQTHKLPPLSTLPGVDASSLHSSSAAT